MGKLTLILGGARSGKSSYAERLALQHGGQVLFVATAQPLDGEMAERIAKHQRKRPEGWNTLELDSAVGNFMLTNLPRVDVILVDCLTLLVSNLLTAISTGTGDDLTVDEEAATELVETEITRLLEAVQAIPAEWMVVSNEVGLGLVPPYPLGRIYRDLLGRANQRIAARSDQVVFMIAGIPMQLTPLASGAGGSA
jgi:adenosylcobinamide kinase / adenosylcobinamide-phosphate guanylyltransferase